MQSQNHSNKEGAGNEMKRTGQSVKKDKVDEERLEPKPEVPPKNSPMMRTFKKVGYSVWLIVMIVGGVLAFFTFIFLL